MLNKLKPKSEFAKNVLTLMTGTTIAQAIPIAISPILTRIYTPEDFGVFALYMSIVSILGVIVTGQYELAIMLPKTKKESVNVLFLSLLLSILMSFVVFLIILLFHTQIIEILNNKDISDWLYFIPFSILLVGFYNSFNYWFNRNKNYKLLSTNKVVQTSINSGMSLSFGFLKMNKIGLIFSSIFSQFVVVLLLVKKFNFTYFGLFNFKLIKNLAKRYKKFPSITLFHNLFNNASTNIPILLIMHYFSNSEAGFFAFTNRIIGFPLSIISSSVSEVFFREINKIKNHEPVKLEIFFKNILFKMIITLLPIFTLLFFTLPYFVGLIFGDKWIELGMYIQILLPMFFFRGIGSILSHTIVVFEKQGKGFILEIISFLLRIISILIGGYFNNIILGLILFSFTSSLVTIYRINWYCNIIKEYIKNES